MLWRRCCIVLLELLMIFFWVSKRPFDLDEEMICSFEFSLALLGYLMELGPKPFSSYSSFLLYFLLLSCISSNVALCPFKLVFQLSDRCDLESSRLRIWFWNRLKKLAVILSVCVVRVSSDIFESARLMLRVDSLQSESARLSVHTWTLLIELARLYSSRLERPVTLAVVLVESALGPSGQLEYLCVLNILRRAMIESARLLFESARVHKFRKLEIQLD